MCRQGIRRRLRQETRGSEGNLCPLTTQLSKYSPVRLRGGYFFTLSYPYIVQIFIGFLFIWITHLHYPVQLDYANTHPFRYRGVLFYSLLFVHCTNLYWLPIIWITPFNPIMQNSPAQMRGNFAYFFLLPQEYFIYFFTSIIRRLLGISDHINCPKQFSSVNALPYRV